MFLKKIVFLSIGGTILCSQTAEGLKTTQKPEHLITQALSNEKLQNIQVIEYLKMDSANLNLRDFLIFNHFVSERKAQPETHSIIVLMGTDNLEHAAFFLSLLSPAQSQTILLTGAMIPYGRQHSDALTNIRDTYQIAVMPYEKKSPVLIVFNGKIYDALGVRKLSTDTPDAFTNIRKPKDFALLSKIIEDKDFFISSQEFSFPKIRTIKITPGEDMTAISDAVTAGSQVIILEGLGNGNVNSETLSQVQKNKDRAIFIVTSQVLYGTAEPIYQSAVRLKKLGAIFAGRLSSGKALILSSLFLSQPHIQKLNLLEKKQKLNDALEIINQ